ERSGKKPGGQKGHPGETLRRSETPDAIIDHYPLACAACGVPLTAAAASDYVARQVFDLPEPQPLIVTEHRAYSCLCGACGAQTRAAFPDWVTAPVQYGKRIGAFVLYLLHYQLLPEKRLAEAMADLFGARLASATIARISQDCARRFEGFVDAVRDQVATAPVKHMDETGFRIGGQTLWLHIASTVLLTFYRVSPKRGSLLAHVTGIVMHDHWKPYYTMTGVLHALCNAHHLRELKALVEIEKEDWARKMQRLLRRACHATNLARERDAPLKPPLIALITRRYDAILAAGLALHEAQPAVCAAAKSGRRGRPPRRVGHNLALRLMTRRQDVLRFLTDPAVPFSSVDDRRGGVSLPVGCRRRFRAAPSVRADMAPFPVAARQTGHAGFRHPAFSRPVKPSLSAGRCAFVERRRDRASRRDTRPGSGRTRRLCVPLDAATSDGLAAQCSCG
ncbi:MAG: IS66 family transposase, partial [Acetobacteraceae bacterium]